MNLRRRIRGTGFAGYYWLTGRRSLLSLVKNLDKFHFAPRSEINIQVNQKLFHLLSHAIQNVPYYRELGINENLTEETVFTYLQKLPILTKDIIRSEQKRLVSEKTKGRVRWNASGGSTGKPISLLHDLNMMNHGRATELLFMRWAGHQMGEPHMLIWTVPQAIFGERLSFHDRFYRLVHNEIYLNCYKITDDILHNWIRSINRKCPTLIEAYVDAIYELSKSILNQKSNITMPRGIIASAGVLTPQMKDSITKAFSCPILNRYGTREVGAIACSCSSNSELHIEEYTCYLEILDDEGNPCEAGVEGNIVVTLLTNYAMPILRYQIEDRGTWATGTCPCGRTTKRLINVNGRQFEFLLAADGTKIHAAPFVYALFSVSSIRRYQLRQKDKSNVTLIVEPATGYNEETITQDMQLSLKKVEKLLLGTSIELVIVDEIIPSKSGKYRYIIRDEIVNT